MPHKDSRTCVREANAEDEEGSDIESTKKADREKIAVVLERSFLVDDTETGVGLDVGRSS